MSIILESSQTGKQIDWTKRQKHLINQMKPIQVQIVPLLGPKCPRCYMKLGIEDNFMSLCDRCCDILLGAADELVELGRLSREESDNMVRDIKDAREAQIKKYANQSGNHI